MIKKGVKICLNCKAIYKDKNATICTKCGHATIDKIITKEVSKTVTKDVRSENSLG